METGIIAGYIEEDISFCPYCGERLDMVSLFAETHCRSCGRSFFVVAGEEDLQSNAKEETV